MSRRRPAEARAAARDSGREELRHRLSPHGGVAGPARPSGSRKVGPPEARLGPGGSAAGAQTQSSGCLPPRRSWQLPSVRSRVKAVIWSRSRSRLVLNKQQTERLGGGDGRVPAAAAACTRLAASSPNAACLPDLRPVRADGRSCVRGELFPCHSARQLDALLPGKRRHSPRRPLALQEVKGEGGLARGKGRPPPPAPAGPGQVPPVAFPLPAMGATHTPVPSCSRSSRSQAHDGLLGDVRAGVGHRRVQGRWGGVSAFPSGTVCRRLPAFRSPGGGSSTGRGTEGESRPESQVQPRGFLHSQVPRTGPVPSEDWAGAGHAAAFPRDPSVLPHPRAQKAGCQHPPNLPQKQHPPGWFPAPQRRLTSPPHWLCRSSPPPWRNVPDPTIHADPAACGLTGAQLPRAHACTPSLPRSSTHAPRGPRPPPRTGHQALGSQRSQPCPVIPESLLPGRDPVHGVPTEGVSERARCCRRDGVPEGERLSDKGTVLLSICGGRRQRRVTQTRRRPGTSRRHGLTLGSLARQKRHRAAQRRGISETRVVPALSAFHTDRVTMGGSDHVL